MFFTNIYAAMSTSAQVVSALRTVIQHELPDAMHETRGELDRARMETRMLAGIVANLRREAENTSRELVRCHMVEETNRWDE